MDVSCSYGEEEEFRVFFTSFMHTSLLTYGDFFFFPVFFNNDTTIFSFFFFGVREGKREGRVRMI